MVAGDTLGDPLTTRDTVAVETPATRATSTIVADGDLVSTTSIPPNPGVAQNILTFKDKSVFEFQL
jgi:hypothetical protein